MKRTLSIMGIAVATFAILTLTALPHHHHGERICFAIEHCDHHDHDAECASLPCNAENTADDCSHNENDCLLSHGTYLVEAENAGIRITAAEIELHLLAEAVDFAQTFTPETECTDFIYGEAVESEYTVEILYGCGLRAPPIF